MSVIGLSRFSQSKTRAVINYYLPV